MPAPPRRSRPWSQRNLAGGASADCRSALYGLLRSYCTRIRRLNTRAAFVPPPQLRMHGPTAGGAAGLTGAFAFLLMCALMYYFTEFLLVSGVRGDIQQLRSNRLWRSVSSSLAKVSAHHSMASCASATSTASIAAPARCRSFRFTVLHRLPENLTPDSPLSWMLPLGRLRSWRLMNCTPC